MAKATENRAGLNLGSALVMIGLVGASLWALHTEFSGVNEKISGVDKHISRVEIAVRIIADKQGGDTKELVDDALTVAQNASDSGNFASAQRALSIANRLLAEQKDVRSTVPTEFFSATLRNYQRLRLVSNTTISNDAFVGTRTLAEYRSTLNSIPPAFSSRKPTTSLSAGTIEMINGRLHLSDAFLSGNAIDNSGGNGFDIDNTTLENVVLEDVKIVYRGGQLALNNVHFVNCEIQVPNNLNSDLLLEAIIQGQTSLTIG
jgi:hypothetical protein